MRLEEYWGVGPKTRSILESAMGEEAAVAAIEAADLQAVVEAGVPSGRATRILRHATGGGGLDALATSDAHTVYRTVLEYIEEFAVTRRVADRIRVLTPLVDQGEMEDRLDRVMGAVDTWETLPNGDRDAVLSVFDAYDSVASDDLPAVEAARGLIEADVTDGIFEPIGTLDAPTLAEAATALRGLEGGEVADGVDDRLDEYRTQLRAARALERDPDAVLEQIRSGEVRATDEFRAVFVEHVAEETGVEPGRIRETLPGDAADATDFVTTSLRALVDQLEADVTGRTESVRADLETDLEAAGDEVASAVEIVDRIALDISLARFALAYDLTRPTFVEGSALAVVGARNMGLMTGDESVQPITYGIGEHGLDAPTERVAVLTGANSGGKTTLLETLCQIAVLARLGLPVPADRAALSPDLHIVFHRRHASFNAGVLESTLRSIVPPLTEAGRALMLVDEFEAITEPGSAADLLHGLVTLTVDGVAGDGTDTPAIGVFVTHLADDLSPLPEDARVDGISAEGLDADLELRVDYQPRFHTVGRSTPEFIVSRLVADADDRRARAGFNTLAEAVGSADIQETLSATRWGR